MGKNLTKKVIAFRKILFNLDINELDPDELSRFLPACIELLQVELTNIIESSLHHVDDLVRVDVVDFLGLIEAERYKKSLLECLQKDDSYLVRGSAAIALANQGVTESLDVLNDRLRTLDGSQEAQEEAVCLYYAKYVLDKDAASFNQLVSGLWHPFYRIRCATAGLLTNLVDETTAEPLERLVKYQLELEDSAAAREPLVLLLEEVGIYKNEQVARRKEP